MAEKTADHITEAQWSEFWRVGYVKLGKTLSNTELDLLKQRVEDIMLGKVLYGDNLLMQLDPGGDQYASSIENFSGRGFKVPTLEYRKVGEAGCGLECDDLFHAFMQKDIFKEACNVVYGHHATVSVYRSMVFNKPANKGTVLPWHQDGGDWWALDRDPLCFVWTALEPVTKENGCVQVVPCSYKKGILSRRGHTLSEGDVAKNCAGQIEDLLCEPGESWLVHNWTIHRSGINSLGVSRLAFSCNYVDARTRVLNPKPPLAGPIGTPGNNFPIIFESSFAPDGQSSFKVDQM